MRYTLNYIGLGENAQVLLTGRTGTIRATRRGGCGGHSEALAHIFSRLLPCFSPHRHNCDVHPSAVPKRVGSQPPFLLEPLPDSTTEKHQTVLARFHVDLPERPSEKCIVEGQEHGFRNQARSNGIRRADRRYVRESIPEIRRRNRDQSKRLTRCQSFHDELGQHALPKGRRYFLRTRRGAAEPNPSTGLGGGHQGVNELTVAFGERPKPHSLGLKWRAATPPRRAFRPVIRQATPPPRAPARWPRLVQMPCRHSETAARILRRCLKQAATLGEARVRSRNRAPEAWRSPTSAAQRAPRGAARKALPPVHRFEHHYLAPRQTGMRPRLVHDQTLRPGSAA